MAHIIPFRGTLYDAAKVSGDDVIAPPYDIVTPPQRDELYRKSPFNIIRVDAGIDMPGDNETHNRYTRARESLDTWIEKGVLVTDESPSIYAYESEYEVRGQKHTLRGFLALVRIEDLGKGVYPHEATHSKPKVDRLNVMRFCLGNISPIYALYNSRHRVASEIIGEACRQPHLSAHDQNGSVHRIAPVSDEYRIRSIREELLDKPVFIADGHHRYEVALEFKREMEEKEGKGDADFRPWNYVLMFLANMADDGITILPTHRLVRGPVKKEAVLERLASDFTIVRQGMDRDITSTLAGAGRNTFGLCLTGEDCWYALTYTGKDLDGVDPALRNLDVTLLHELILKRDLGITDVSYEMDVRESVSRVRAGEYDAAFFLNPTGVDDVERVALSGVRMPPKSTYFYPKLLTGMVIYSFRHQF